MLSWMWAIAKFVGNRKPKIKPYLPTAYTFYEPVITLIKLQGISKIVDGSLISGPTKKQIEIGHWRTSKKKNG